MLTYRLADSLPREVLDELAARRSTDRNALQEDRDWIDSLLDSGHGSCALREPRAAELVVNAWKYFDAQRYDLHAWVVMPNHVHLLVKMRPPYALGEVVESWKRFTATRINRFRGTKGSFWQEDYFDRFVRDEAHYAEAVHYIHENPVRAGLVKAAVDWPWSSASGARRSDAASFID